MRRMLASLLGPALSLGWACNVLAIEPGTPLEVHLRWPVAIDRSQSLDPAEVRFEVAGCPDTFSVEAMWTYTGPLGGLPEDGHRPPSSVAVPFTTSPEGDYVARLVPQGAAEEAFLCASDDDRPYTGDLRLRVTCVDGRQAMTHAIPVRLAPVATRAASYVEANIDGVVATANPNRVFTYGQGWAGVWHRDAPERPGSLDEPLPWGYELLAVRGETFVSRDGRGYVVAAGCPVPDCGRTRLPDDRGTVENSYIYVLDLDYQESYAPQPQGTAPRRLVVDGFVVAGWVQQLVAEGDGTLRVLSFTPSRRGDWHGSWVSRVRDHEVSVERFWDGELPMFMAGVPPARPAGDSTAVLFAFAPSTESLSLRLRDLRSDTLTPIVLPDTVHAEDTRRGFGLDLAPEYDQWALAVGQDVYLGGPLQPWQRLPLPLPPPTETPLPPGLYPSPSVAWTPSSLLVRRQDGLSVAFPRRGEVRPTFIHEQPKTAFVAAQGLRSGHFLLMDEHGITIVAPHGEVVGAVSHCEGRSRLPMHVAELSDGAVALSGRFLRLLDMGRYAP